ncbi:nucleotidyl transferase AbiEii/AbiGii toxin family protein [Bacteroidales bacterium OttesenSCG-928-L19]|nr:nucleotidyl transferase AbiEii/AbiGii toxin family protein [Bacteroidales bacterium OttesenSCG-928-L19]
MIKAKCASKNWIEAITKSTKAKDTILVEKVIKALMLLEGLAKSDLNFVFKGGTALMLLFKSNRRLSIDIDIITPDKYVVLDSILEKICKEYGFIRFKSEERNAKTQIDKMHYKLFFESAIEKKESYVLLDILKEEIQYQNVIEAPIESVFVELDATPISVRIPDFNDILGDKLTAFAPNTTGIPYKKGSKEMGMEIIKQMYDIGSLFDHANNVEIISAVFSSFANTELQYRRKACSISDVLDDIIENSLEICLRGNYGKANFEVLSKGILQVKGFIYSESFHLDKAIVYAAKVAYVAGLIKYKKKEIKKFDVKKTQEMKDWLIKEPISTKLNKLKKSNAEAFFYLYQLSELISDE